jgi:hypothetical protein
MQMRHVQRGLGLAIVCVCSLSLEVEARRGQNDGPCRGLTSAEQPRRSGGGMICEEWRDYHYNQSHRRVHRLGWPVVLGLPNGRRAYFHTRESAAGL